MHVNDVSRFKYIACMYIFVCVHLGGDSGEKGEDMGPDYEGAPWDFNHINIF